MRKLLLAMLGLAVLFFILGCPPKTDVSDRFGPGPGRDRVVEEQPTDPAAQGTKDTEGTEDTEEEATPDETGGEDSGGETPDESPGEKPEKPNSR